MLAGETVSSVFHQGLYLFPTSATRLDTPAPKVSIRITNFRVYIGSFVENWHAIDIPLANIREVNRSLSAQFVDIYTKHVWSFRIAGQDERVLNDLYAQLNARIPKKMSDLFCFPHHRELLGEGTVDSGWGIYNPETELKRQCATDDLAPAGLGSNILRWFHLIQLPSEPFLTYPLSIIQPRRSALELLLRAAKFRQNARIPAISWINLETGGSIARCSQPLVGTTMRGSNDDEQLLSYLNQSLHLTANPLTGGSTPPQSPTALSPSAFATVPRSMTTGSIVAPSPKFAPPPSLFEDAKPQGATGPAPTSPSLQPLRDEPSRDFVNIPPQSPQLESEQRKLHIFDCRSRAAATANMANGGGYEQTQNYDRCKLQFLGLDNIHSVKQIFEKLSKTIQSEKVKLHLDCNWSKLESTGWPALVQGLVFHGAKAAQLVAEGDSVLVHCTDGWDRTSQVVSLAMLLSDTYYRTVEGFCVLIEREWLQMGFRFADRCGHDLESDDFLVLQENGEEREDTNGLGTGGTPGVGVSSPSPAMKDTTKPVYSPVFIQWIDAVYQVMKMFPTEFEFTPRLLIVISDAVYSCRFGTFLYNCYRSRFRPQGVATKTASLWSEIQRLVRAEQYDSFGAIPAGELLLNPFFDRVRHRKSLATSRRLSPNFAVRRYSFFSAWYCRYDAAFNGSHPSDSVGLEPEDLTPLIEVFLSNPAIKQERAALAAARNANFDSFAAQDAVGLWPNRVPVPELIADTEWKGRRSPVPVLRDPLLAGATWDTPTSQQQQPSPAQLQTPSSGTGREGGFKERSDSRSCELCGVGFTFLNRRHTCRRCSRACCSGCGAKYVNLTKEEIILHDEKDASGPLRVCNECYSIWTRKQQTGFV